MKVPEITVEDWKDWAHRHDIPETVPDEPAFAEALHNVYLREQAIEDQREANREKHLRQSERTVLALEKSNVGCSQASSGGILRPGNSEVERKRIFDEGESSKVSVGDRVPAPRAGSIPAQDNIVGGDNKKENK